MAVDVRRRRRAGAGGRGGRARVSPAWPGMARGFWQDDDATSRPTEAFPGVWVHGDWASVDEDGCWYLRALRRHAEHRRQADRQPSSSRPPSPSLRCSRRPQSASHTTSRASRVALLYDVEPRGDGWPTAAIALLDREHRDPPARRPASTARGPGRRPRRAARARRADRRRGGHRQHPRTAGAGPRRAGDAGGRFVIQRAAGAYVAGPPPGGPHAARLRGHHQHRQPG